MVRDKLKDVSNLEIEVTLERAGDPQSAAKLLGVSVQALYAEVKRRDKVLGPTLRKQKPPKNAHHDERRGG